MKSIVIKDLRKYFGPIKAVDGVSIDVSQGEIFGMLGPNGAGKTTTIETIIGLTERDSGQVEVLGMDPQVEGVKLKERIGVSLQVLALFPRLTVREILKLYSGFYSKSHDIDEIIALVDLEDKANSRILKMSGGQQKRLDVALAFINEADIYFLDEPTSGLDPQSRRHLWGLIKEMKERGKTIFLTTHYMDEAEKLCDRVAIIDAGKIIALDTPARLIAHNFKEKAIEFYHEGLAEMIAFNDLKGAIDCQVQQGNVVIYSAMVPQTIGALLEQARALGTDIDDLTVRAASLEDVFIKMTGRRIRE